MSTSSASDPYASHAEWLRGLRAQYDAMHEGTHPVGDASPLSSSRGEFALPGGDLLTPPPTVWIEEAAGSVDELSASFGGAALEFADFDEEPVYRSLGGALGVFGADEAADEGGARAVEAPAAPAGRGELVEARWLESMPPMLRRQRAQRSSLVA